MELPSPAPNGLAPAVVVASSGRCARTSQLSATVCPVLVPPANVKPAGPQVERRVEAVEVLEPASVVARIRDEIAHLTGLVRRDLV